VRLKARKNIAISTPAGIAKAKADGLGVFDMRAGAEKAQQRRIFAKERYEDVLRRCFFRSEMAKSG
jgi:hypothetical protein